jgi:hypothetical protein
MRAVCGCEVTVWYLFQSMIMFAVIGSNIHYQWGEPYAVAGIAVFCAFAATALLGDLIRLLHRLRKRLARPR